MTNGGALGLIETIGLGAAAAALDAATKTADVTCVGVERVIGVGKVVSVTINLAGTVAAVQSSVEAGVEAANAVGTVVSHRVIARPHTDVQRLIKMFEKSKTEEEEAPAEEPKKTARKSASAKKDEATTEASEAESEE